MRIDRVNSYLSTVPANFYQPIHPVGRESQSFDQPEVAPVKTISFRQVDTMSSGPLLSDLIPRSNAVLASEIDAQEARFILDHINREKTRRDHVEYTFPGLLKA